MSTFLKANWQNLIMANYEIDPTYLLPYLPKGVELDFFEGKTFVSLVGFLFQDTSIFKVPIPFYGTFEEINLRFYVKRKIGDEVRRGVVFVNETVPNKMVAWVANKLYKEHYIAIPTRHQWLVTDQKKEIQYQWKVKSKWNSIKVAAAVAKQEMEKGSMEEFIFEHYYGYTKVNDKHSIEYRVNHPRWETHEILDYQIDCDFAAFYGDDFQVLNHSAPHSIMLA
ncbi:MAG: YqjF family protein, partial [Saprospiraceae bacterium]